MTTKRTKAILTLGGVFLVGAICGAMAVGTFVRSEVRSAERLRDRGGFQEYFAEQLELTTAQRDSLQGELDWFYRELAGLRAAAAGEAHDLIDSLDRRLAARLLPEQRERLRTAESRLRRQLPAGRPAPLSIEAADVAPSAGTPAAPRDTMSAAADPTSSATPSVETPGSDRAKADGPAADDPALADTLGPSASAIDPGDEMSGLRDRIAERLELSDGQSASIREIIQSTRRQIRRDISPYRGFPRLQLEMAGRRLREMDRSIVDLLDARQRAAYEPIRREVARKIRARILKSIGKEKPRR